MRFVDALTSTLVPHARRIWAGLDLGGAKNHFVGCAGGGRIVVGCVFVEFENVDRRIDIGIGKYGVDDGVGGWERDVRDAGDVGGEWDRGWRAVDDVLPRRGAEWSGA